MIEVVADGVLAPAGTFTRASSGSYWGAEIASWTAVTAYPIFPTLSGRGWGAKFTPQYSTAAKRSASLRRYALSLAQYPYYKIEIPYNYLDAQEEDLVRLEALLHQVQGSGGLFYYDDPARDSCDHQEFATSDGTVGPYQLMRGIADQSEPVYGTFGECTAYVNGTAVAATFDGAGNVTFAVAPANGATLAWSGRYFFLCCFANDALTFEDVMDQIFKADSVQLETTMP